MFRDPRRRRGSLPRCREWHRWSDAHDNGRKRVENSERDCGRERCGRWARFVARRLRTAIVGSGLRDLRSGRGLIMMMKRARTVLTALQACFRRRLPAGTLGHRALCERENADDRRHLSQDRPHTLRMRCHGQSVKQTDQAHRHRNADLEQTTSVSRHRRRSQSDETPLAR